MVEPSRGHWNVVKRIMRYIKGTLAIALYFGKSELIVTNYVDLDYANYLNKRKSTTSYLFTFARGEFVAKIHNVVALSTIKVEYMEAT